MSTAPASASPDLKPAAPPPAKVFDFSRYTRIAQLILAVIFLAVSAALEATTSYPTTNPSQTHYLIFVPAYSIVATLYFLYVSLHPSASIITFTHRTFGAYQRHVMPIVLEFTVWVLWLAAWAVAASSLASAELDRLVRDEGLFGADVAVGVLVWLMFSYSFIGDLLMVRAVAREEEEGVSRRMPGKIVDAEGGKGRGCMGCEMG